MMILKHAKTSHDDDIKTCKSSDGWVGEAERDRETASASAHNDDTKTCKNITQ